MGDYLDLPHYTGYELIEEDNRTGITVHRAHVVNQPHKRVTIKSLQFHSEEENNNLRHEYELLKQLNTFLEENYIKEAIKPARRRSSIKLAALPMMIGEGGFPSNPNLPTKQQPLIPCLVALEKMYEEGYNAIVCEDFDGISLRKYYPSMVASNSLENLMDRSSHSLASIDRSKESIHTPQVDPELKKLDFEEVLQVMIQLAEAVDVCHRCKIAHLDINPNNILIQKSRNKITLQLTNFYNSLRFDQMSHSFGRALRGYTYVSPEQTGRTDRVLDYRSDMYSLGITFWELLVEDVPFKYTDAAEMIYAHLAKNVPSPTSKHDYIPQQLSNIVLKLVQKDPSERYQLASAVRYDLQRCLDRWNDTRVRKGWKSIAAEHIKEAFADWTFTIAEKDYSQVISFPSRPIGRQEQMEQLKNVFEEWNGTIASDRRGLFVCLSGPRGCGKHTFWEELCRIAISNNCFTVEAEIHEEDFDVPYFAYRSILDQLVKILLAESTVSLKNWEEKLVAQVGIPRLTLLSFLVPSITHIVMSLPKGEDNALMSDSKPLELYQAVQYFLDLFATEEHPLLINLNYLNAGPGTVEMTSYLVNTPLGKTCMFLGYMYSIEEQAPPNSLSPKEILEMLTYPRLELIEFRVLSVHEIQSFLSDILKPCSQSTEQLATILHRRTSGNYSFLKEFIKFCEKKDLIIFDASNLLWTWDLKKIETDVEITNNAAELIMMQVNDLEPTAQYLLKCAACVGHTFDVRIASHVSNISITQVQTNLNHAAVAGYIIPCPSLQRNGSEVDSSKSASVGALSNSGPANSSTSLSQEFSSFYKFCHPLLSKRLSESLAISEKETISLQIARHFRGIVEEKFGARTTDMLKHYLAARNLVKDDTERIYVAGMYHKASFRAASLQSAVQCLDHSIEFLRDVSVPTIEVEDLSFQVHCAKAKAIIQLDHIGDAERLIQEMTEKAHTKERAFRLTSLRVMTLAAKGEVKNGIELAMTCDSGIARYIQQFRFFTDNDYQLIENLDGLFGSRTVDDILTKKRCADDSLSVAEQMVTTCIQICQKKGDIHGASYFNILACSMSLNFGVSKNSSENFASVLPYFLGRFFNYFDFKRARFIGELVLAASQSLNSEGKLNALQGLLKGYSYFWSYYEANERMNQAVKAAIDDRMVSKAFDVMLTFHTAFLLPYGKSIATVRECDKRFKSFSEFSAAHHRQWDMMLTSFDAIASGFPVQTLVEADFSPHLNAFLLFTNSLISLLYAKEDKFEKFQALAKVEDQIHGSWLYLNLNLDMLTICCLVFFSKQKESKMVANPLRTARKKWIQGFNSFLLTLVHNSPMNKN
jgi:serine/threonine protein kinase/predicted ATPase